MKIAKDTTAPKATAPAPLTTAVPKATTAPKAKITAPRKPAGETRQIQAALSRLESLGAARTVLFAFVEEDLKRLDKSAGEEKKRLAAILKGIANAVAAVGVANALAPTEPSSSDLRRKQLSRRRAILIKALEGAYPVYDFAVGKGRGGGTITATFVGDADVREARRLLAAVADLVQLGIKIPSPAETVIVAAIKAKTTKSSATPEKSLFIPPSEGFALVGIDLEAMRARISAKITATTVAAEEVKKVANG